MIQDELDICGTHFPLASIKDYQIVQREYIYRPAYRERMKRGFSLRKFVQGEFEFAEMIPYAAVLVSSDKDYKLATKSAEVKSLGEAAAKDIAVGILSKLNAKVNKKRYHCRNIAGRCFTVYLEDIPAVLIRGDGKMSDVYKNDELYPLLGEPIAPIVMTVPALSIKTKKEDYLFFGNRIQLEDVSMMYQYLRQRLETMKLEQGKEPSAPRTIKMPDFAQKLLTGKTAKSQEEPTDISDDSVS